MAKDRNPVIVPAGFKIKKLPIRRARHYGSLNTRKGGMSGASTGGNGIGIVPAAFRN